MLSQTYVRRKGLLLLMDLNPEVRDDFTLNTGGINGLHVIVLEALQHKDFYIKERSLTNENRIEDTPK